MSAFELLALIDRVFPFLPRPSLSELTAHSDGCLHCEMVYRELLNHPSPELSDEAIRFLCDEFDKLSAKSIAWIFPSYLRYVLTREDDRNPRPTEFLIYNLSPSAEVENEYINRFSRLNLEQFECLLAVVDFLSRNDGWVEYCKIDLLRADAFLRESLDCRTNSTRK